MRPVLLSFLCRIACYLLGLLLLSFAVVFAINSGLGISPINAFPYALSLVTHIDLGACVTLVFTGYILIQILLLRRRFKWYNLFQLVFSALFGYFVDFSKQALGEFTIPTYAGQLLMLAISLVLVAFGVSFTVGVRLIPMPPEGLTLALTETTGYSFHNVKIVQDCTYILLALACTMIFLGRPEGIQEGTIITALFAGKLIAPAQKVVTPLLASLCFPKDGDVQRYREINT